MAIPDLRARRALALIVCGAGFLAFLLWLSWAIAIAPPRVPDRQGVVHLDTDYEPVRPGCHPAELERIQKPALKLSKTNDCAADAERHRIDRESLHQASRTTDAAEEGVRLTFQQTRIAFFQAIFSVFALVFTGWAAWAASRAGRAAEKAVSHADEVMRNDLRAYVHVERAEVTWGAKGARPVITLFAKNTGQTPARWFGASTKVLTTDDSGDRTFDLSAVDLSDRPMIQWSALGGQGAELSFYGVKEADYAALRDAFDNNKILNVVGRVRYETLFGEIYETEFWFRRRPPHRPKFRQPEGAASGIATFGVAKETAQTLQRAPVALSSYKRLST